jgi:hypothetical protein
MGKLFEKMILRTIQKHDEERNLLIASQFGFRADHSTTLQYMRLADHVTLNNNNMSTAVVLSDIEKAFDTTMHSSLLHELSELEFSASLINLRVVASFLTDRKFKDFVDGEFYRAKKYNGRGSSKFWPCPNIVYSIYK